jgi:hypothetical protein
MSRLVLNIMLLQRLGVIRIFWILIYFIYQTNILYYDITLISLLVNYCTTSNFYLHSIHDIAYDTFIVDAERRRHMQARPALSTCPFGRLHVLCRAATYACSTGHTLIVYVHGWASSTGSHQRSDQIVGEKSQQTEDHVFMCMRIACDDCSSIYKVASHSTIPDHLSIYYSELSREVYLEGTETFS